jgi:hypothetical protein
MVEDSDQSERPRVEPEIIPPDRTRRAPDWRQQGGRPYVSTLTGETHRIYIGRLGPFGIALLILIVGVLVAVILLAIVGVLLVWIPLAALILLLAAFSGLRRWRRS